MRRSQCPLGVPSPTLRPACYASSRSLIEGQTSAGRGRSLPRRVLRLPAHGPLEQQPPPHCRRRLDQFVRGLLAAKGGRGHCPCRRSRIGPRRPTWPFAQSPLLAIFSWHPWAPQSPPRPCAWPLSRSWGLLPCDGPAVPSSMTSFAQALPVMSAANSTARRRPSTASSLHTRHPPRLASASSLNSVPMRKTVLQCQFRLRYSYLLFKKFLSAASPSIARPALDWGGGHASSEHTPMPSRQKFRTPVG